MSGRDAAELIQQATQWWSTEIIDMKLGVIRFRGYPIQQLIGAVSFPQMIWLMLRGDLPSADQAALPEAPGVRGRSWPAVRCQSPMGTAARDGMTLW
jgi:citrate synthase